MRRVLMLVLTEIGGKHRFQFRFLCPRNSIGIFQKISESVRLGYLLEWTFVMCRKILGKPFPKDKR